MPIPWRLLLPFWRHSKSISKGSYGSDTSSTARGHSASRASSRMWASKASNNSWRSFRF